MKNMDTKKTATPRAVPMTETAICTDESILLGLGLGVGAAVAFIMITMLEGHCPGVKEFGLCFASPAVKGSRPARSLR